MKSINARSPAAAGDAARQSASASQYHGRDATSLPKPGNLIRSTPRSRQSCQQWLHALQPISPDLRRLVHFRPAAGVIAAMRWRLATASSIGYRLQAAVPDARRYSKTAGHFWATCMSRQVLEEQAVAIRN